MPTYEDSGQRLRNARVRLDQILDSLPPDVTHHVANMIHNIADAILRTEGAGEEAGRGRDDEGYGPRI